MKLRSHLLVLVMAVLAPMIAFSAVVVVAFGRQQRAEVERGALETTRALMNAVDESLHGSVSQLVGLAHARSLARGDLREFDADVKHALLAEPDWYTVLLYSPDGTARVSGLHPFGTGALPRPDRAAFDTLRATREPVVGDLAPGPMPGLYHIPIMVPVLRQETVRYVLIALVKPISLVPVLTRQRIPEEWVGTIFDRNKRIVARTKGPEHALGQPVSPEFASLLEWGSREGSSITTTLEGASVFTAYVRSPLTGWGIGLGIPAASVYAPLRLSLLALVGGGLVVIALALVLAAMVGRRITGPIAALARGARAFGQGESLDAGGPAGVEEIDEVRRAFQEAGTLVRQRALEAERANRAKDEFLAVLSHELRTPLNAVYGWARMLQTGQVDAATRARALDVIVRQSNAQVQLIDDLLDVSRMSVGKMRLDVRQVDLPAVIEHALDAIRPAAAAKNIRLQPALDPRAGPVVGDPDRLQQVVWNLLMNAVKFTPKGGRVRLSLQPVDAHVEIVVSDDGPGIAPEVLPYIFEPFRQGDSSSTRAHAGLGLGLALVRQLVALHGGSVTARSDGVGKGATLLVRLPIAEPGGPSSVARAHPLAAAEPGAGRIVRLDGVRVVVADDDPEALDLASMILGGAGAQVRTCPSAAEALDSVRELVPDVLISDIEMPGEDGYSLLRRVRALPPERGGRVPAVALTAYGRTQDRVQSLAAGFTMHVPKPVDPGELTTIVASVCRINAG
ncbi:MAG TPA: ATP-binding protein [Methylomirabilota bacterium]|nr:ATP-binding protein [Methylomirabilota bacterium]